ncbi:MAG TPA: EpsI family protein [Bryobacteraceae bacterium]|nr:EpsI family protein [Bryobacteraceae bacterium]
MSWRFWAAVALLAGTLAGSKAGASRQPDALEHSLDALPLVMDGWTGTDLPRLTEKVEARLAATQYLSRVYRKNGREMTLLVSYYSEQKAGESMHSPQACLPGAGWEPWKHSIVQVPVEGRNVSANLYSVQKQSQRMQVLYWYQSRKRILASEYSGKVMLLWDSIQGSRTGGSLVRLMMPDTPDSVEKQVQFASKLIPAMQQCLGR